MSENVITVDEKGGAKLLENKTVRNFFNKFGSFVKSIFTFCGMATKRAFIAIGVIMLMLVGLWFFNAPAQKMMRGLGEAAFSSPSVAHEFNVGTVNAHFNRAWVLGTRQISFKNKMVNGWLEADGDMKFKITTPDGAKAIVKGNVAIEPALVMDINQRYTFMDNGIHGSFYTVEGGGIEDFRLSVNMNVIGK